MKELFLHILCTLCWYKYIYVPTKQNHIIKLVTLRIPWQVVSNMINFAAALRRTHKQITGYSLILVFLSLSKSHDFSESCQMIDLPSGGGVLTLTPRRNCRWRLEHMYTGWPRVQKIYLNIFENTHFLISALNTLVSGSKS